MASSAASTGFESSDHSLFSIQELIKKPLLSVPQQYVRVDQQPSTFFDKSSSPTIPTIDMKALFMEETRDFELEKLHLTCKEWGIFQLVNHGVSSPLLEKLREEIEAFFKLPLEEKMKYRVRPGDVEGYGNIVKTSEQKLDWGDRVFMIANPISRRKPYLIPELPSSLRSTLESYFMNLEKLATTLFGLLAKALEVEKREMDETFEDGMRGIRMTYYPPCPQPELVIGISPHSDVSGLTILNQLNGVDGLQVKKDGLWIPVHVLPDAFLVNVGDILEIMSNGVYKSAEHKVTVNNNKERISVAMFFNPKYEADIKPLASLISPQNPPLFKNIRTEKYVEDFFSRRKLDGKSFLDHMKIKTGENNTN
ncbi:hypothetical protein UlMin_018790 [Ulmus minor]